MKGSNTIKVNEATMMEAMQYWINSWFVAGEAPTVTSVKSSKDDLTFDIEVESKEKP